MKEASQQINANGRTIWHWDSRSWAIVVSAVAAGRSRLLFAGRPIVQRFRRRQRMAATASIYRQKHRAQWPRWRVVLSNFRLVSAYTSEKKNRRHRHIHNSAHPRATQTIIHTIQHQKSFYYIVYGWLFIEREEAKMHTTANAMYQFRLWFWLYANDCVCYKVAT